MQECRKYRSCDESSNYLRNWTDVVVYFFIKTPQMSQGPLHEGRALGLQSGKVSYYYVDHLLIVLNGPESLLPSNDYVGVVNSPKITYWATVSSNRTICTRTTRRKKEHRLGSSFRVMDVSREASVIVRTQAVLLASVQNG